MFNSTDFEPVVLLMPSILSTGIMLLYILNLCPSIAALTFLSSMMVRLCALLRESDKVGSPGDSYVCPSCAFANLSSEPV